MQKLILAGFLFLIPLFVGAQTYGSDYLTGGTITCSSAEFGACANMVDNNDTTYWIAENATWPHWIKYDVGAGNHKHMAKTDILIAGDVGGCGMKDVSVYGSINDVTWDLVFATSTVSNCTTNTVFSTSTANPSTFEYRYFKWYFPDGYRASNQTYLLEMQAYECTDCTGGEATSTTFGTSTARDAFNYRMSFLLDGLIIAVVGWGIYKFTYGRHSTL